MTQSTGTQTITITDPDSPVTEKQAGFLAKLTKERDNKSTAERYRLMSTLGTLTKGQASKLISEFLASPKKTTAPSAPVSFTYPDGSKGSVTPNVPGSFPVPAPQPFVAPKPVELPRMPAEGYYEIDDKLYYWACTSKDSKPTLRRWSPPAWGGVKYRWAKVGFQGGPGKTTGSYTPWKGGKYEGQPQTDVTVWAPKILIDGKPKPMTLDQVKAKGKQLNFCIKCGAQLTDPFSVANGVGPICIKTIGL